MELISNFSHFELEPLVVGGENSVPNSFPYQVNIQLYGEFRCGGSILNSLFILTAAHCLFNEDHDKISTKGMIVVAGDYNIKKIGGIEQTRTVYQFYIHPGYNSSSRISEDDIAILRLGKPLNLNEFVQPISYPRHAMNFTGFGIISGWGQTEYLNDELSNILQEATLPLVPKDECKNMIYYFNLRYEESIVFNENEICAGSEGIGACFGDSGGPLVCKEEGGSDILCGIVSSTVNCGYKNPLPTFFTDVSKYSDWIEVTISKPSEDNHFYWPIVGEGCNEVERLYLPNSPFELGNIQSSAETINYPVYNKIESVKFSVDFISIVSQSFKSYNDYLKNYLTQMYPDLPLTLERIEKLNVFVKKGSYIEEEGYFSFAVIEYLGFHKLDNSVAIKSWDPKYLEELRELKQIRMDSSCNEKLSWKQFFRKYGTHYTRQITIGKIIEKRISVNGKEEIEQLKETWGVVDSGPLSPMINQSFPYVTEQGLKEESLEFVPTLKMTETPIYQALEESAKDAEKVEKKEEFRKFVTKFKYALLLYRTNEFAECDK